MSHYSIALWWLYLLLCDDGFVEKYLLGSVKRPSPSKRRHQTSFFFFFFYNDTYSNKMAPSFVLSSVSRRTVSLLLLDKQQQLSLTVCSWGCDIQSLMNRRAINITMMGTRIVRKDFAIFEHMEQYLQVETRYTLVTIWLLDGWLDQPTNAVSPELTYKRKRSSL